MTPPLRSVRLTIIESASESVCSIHGLLIRESERTTDRQMGTRMYAERVEVRQALPAISEAEPDG